MTLLLSSASGKKRTIPREKGLTIYVLISAKAMVIRFSSSPLLPRTVLETLEGTTPLPFNFIAFKLRLRSVALLTVD